MSQKVNFLTEESEVAELQQRQHRLVQLIEQLLLEGWTQTTLAEAMDVDFSTVYRWLKGKTVR
jgi:DNA-directed RNA polymerase specialized sigma24 family protein